MDLHRERDSILILEHEHLRDSIFFIYKTFSESIYS